MTVSPAGSSIGKLSYQDRIGYETIRSLRRPVDELNDLLHVGLNAKSYIVYLKARRLQ